MSLKEYGWIFFRVLLIQHLVALPISLGGKNVFDQTGAFSILLPLPSITRILIDLLFCVLLDDLLFYIGHRLVKKKKKKIFFKCSLFLVSYKIFI